MQITMMSTSNNNLTDDRSFAIKVVRLKVGKHDLPIFLEERNTETMNHFIHNYSNTMYIVNYVDTTVSEAIVHQHIPS